MATVLLFHSILGLRPLERGMAARWRAAGHEVIAPDLYGGRNAESMDAGFALRDATGWEAIVAEAGRASAGVAADAVLAGVSMGAGVAAELWPERPRARGLLLLHGVVPLPPAPMAGQPVAMHLAEPDPFEEEEYVADFVAHGREAGLVLEVFRYPGAGHLFSDPALPDHDAEAAARMWPRVEAFLARV